MPLWHLPIPILLNGGTCTPSLRLPAHSVHAHTGYLLVIGTKLVPLHSPTATKLCPEAWWGLRHFTHDGAKLNLSSVWTRIVLRRI
eukprot:227715-Pelagomonas_calceolata.AAC.1